jgi:hypothetical protein
MGESEVRGVSRVEGRSPGWKVRTWDPKEQKHRYVAFFGDRVHGGRAAARVQAEACSIEQGCGGRSYQYITRTPASDRSKLPVGVHILKHRVTKKPRAVRACLRIGGVRYQRDFAIGKSRKTAIKKAIEARAEFERLHLPETRSIYRVRHTRRRGQRRTR